MKRGVKKAISIILAAAIMLPGAGTASAAETSAEYDENEESFVQSYEEETGTDENEEVSSLNGNILEPVSSGDATQIHKPRKNTNSGETVTTWDCIWFGNYWQEDTNGDGHCYSEDYPPGSTTYKADSKQPIKWRVLDIDQSGNALLLADKLIDIVTYNSYSDVTWETCKMRSYLNGYDGKQNVANYDYTGDNSFIYNAFSESERNEIITADLTNPDNPVYGTKGGNPTHDKIFCLSLDEAMTADYGFNKNVLECPYTGAKYYTGGDSSRVAVTTKFTDDKPGYDGNTAGSSAMWWLRSPGYNSKNASYVARNGAVYARNNYDVIALQYCVRPAFRMNLSSSLSLWTYAGTVSSDGTENEEGKPTGPSGDDIATKGIKLDCNSVNLEKNETKSLKYTIFPRNATNRGVTFTSSAPSVATVDSKGVVKALAEGTSDIEAVTSDGGYKASCRVTVTPNSPRIQKLDFKGKNAGFKVSDDIPLVGGDTFSLDMPVGIPVSCVIEDGKIKIGINIKKKNLYSYNSTEGVTTTSKNKSIKEQFEDFKKNAMKANYMARDEDWLKNIQDEKFRNYNIPGLSKSVDVDVVGYVEGTWSDSLDTLQGSLAVRIKGSATVQSQMVIVIVPVTVNCKFSASGTLTATLGYDFRNAQWYGDLQLAAAVGIEPYAGIGFGQWLSGGVYGKGELSVTFTLLSTRDTTGLDSCSLSGELGVKGYFAKLEGKWALLSGTYEIYSRYGGVSSAGSNATIDYSVEYITLPPLGELSRSTTASDGTLISDAYPAAEPQIITAGDTTMLLYLMDDTERTGLNQTKLVYRLYNSETGVFGETKAVLDDGTADFAHTVCSDGENIYVAWLDSNRIFDQNDEPEVIDYMKTFGVRAARYDALSDSFDNLGRPKESFHYSYQPRIYAADGVLNLAWVENLDDILYGLSDNNTVFRYSYSDAWSEKASITKCHAITSLALGDIGSGVEIAFAEDCDNDLTTPEQKVFFSQNTEDKRLEMTWNVSSLAFTKLPSESGVTLAMNKDGALYSYQSGSYTEVLPENTMDKDSAFSVYGNSVYYVVSGEENRNIAVATFEKSSGSEWRTTMLTHETGYVDYFSNPSGEIAYLCTDAEYDDASGEWITSSSVKVLDSSDYYDTSLECVDFAPSDAYPGMELPLDLYIRNNGTERVSEVSVAVQYGGEKISNDTLRVDLPSGVTECYGYTFKVPEKLSSGGEFLIEVKSDKDADTENDSKNISVLKADLEVGSAVIQEGTKQYLVVNVLNKGLKESNAVTRITDEEGNELYRKSGTVKPDETVTYREEYRGKEGDILTVTVNGDAEEFYEMNNVTWQVMSAPEENVINVTSVSLPVSATVKVGKTVTLTPDISPSNATDKTVTWKSSAPGVATVSTEGVVTGVKEGPADITVTTNDGGFTATCRVTVTKDGTDPGPDPSEEDLEKDIEVDTADRDFDMLPGEIRRLPINRTGKYVYGVSYVSSDPKTVSVKNGIVTAKNLKKGETEKKATVTATYNGESVPFVITVKAGIPDISAGQKGNKITVSKTVKADVGTSKTVTATVKLPKALQGKAVKPDKTDYGFFTLEETSPDPKGTKASFKVTPKEAGAAYVVWTVPDDSGNKSQAYTKVLIKKPLNKLFVSSAETGLDLSVGEGKRLLAATTTGNTDPKDLSFSVKGKGVKVSKSGFVTAITPGARADVTVKAGKYQKTVTVRVKDHTGSILALNKTSVNVKLPKQGAKPKTMALKVTMPKKDPPKVTWSITDSPKGITVDSDGKVTVTSDASPGCYTVAATPEETGNGYNPVSCEIIVK